MRREEKRDEEDKKILAQLRDQHESLAEVIDLTEGFLALSRLRQGEPLDSWLEQAAKSSLQAFERFAKGIWQDYEAVKAGLTLPWS